MEKLPGTCADVKGEPETEEPTLIKRGFFSLLVSLIFGAMYLFACFDHVHSVFASKEYLFFTKTYTLPELRLPAYMIVIILALVMNLIALIFSVSSVAAGAAVLYGAAMAFQPDCYPYVLVEFLLCIIAAVRQNCRPYQEDSDDAGGNGTGTGAGRNGRSAASGRGAAAGAGAGRSSLAASAGNRKAEPVQVHYSDYSEYENAKKKNDALLKQMESGSSRDTGAKSILTITIVTFAMIALVVILMNYLNSSKKTKESEWSWKTTLGTQNGDSQSTGLNTDLNTGHSTGLSTDQSTGHSSGLNTDQSTDLSGYWTMSGDTKTRLGAEIRDKTIDVYWLLEDGRQMLYWSGSYEAPKDSELPYTWISKRDEERMEGEPFAASDDSREFIYDGDGIRFAVGSSGTNLIVRLRRSEELK